MRIVKKEEGAISVEVLYSEFKDIGLNSKKFETSEEYRMNAIPSVTNYAVKHLGIYFNGVVLLTSIENGIIMTLQGNIRQASENDGETIFTPPVNMDSPDFASSLLQHMADALGIDIDDCEIDDDYYEDDYEDEYEDDEESKSDTPMAICVKTAMFDRALEVCTDLDRILPDDRKNDSILYKNKEGDYELYIDAGLDTKQILSDVVEYTAPEKTVITVKPKDMIYAYAAEHYELISKDAITRLAGL